MSFDSWNDSPETSKRKLAEAQNKSDKLDNVSGPYWDNPDYSYLVEKAKGQPEFDLSSFRSVSQIFAFSLLGELYKLR